MRPGVVVFDACPDDDVYFREHLGDQFRLTFSAGSVAEDVDDVAADAEVVSVSVSSQVTADVMRSLLPKVRLVACRSTGYDNVDLDHARAQGIAVSTVPGYGDATVAEYAALLMLAVSRRLVRAVRAVEAGEVVTTDLTGHDLSGRTLGLFGAGRIGRHLAGIARGLGLTVIANDPRPDETAARDVGFTYVGPQELLARSDIISLHAPAVEGTHHLLDRTAFAGMRRGVVIINTARGDLIDTPALIEALEAGIVSGAGLDVLEGEQYLQSANERQLLISNVVDGRSRQVLALDVLGRMPNVVITDHNAFNTVEALARIRVGTVANIHAWHTGSPVNLAWHERSDGAAGAPDPLRR
jgi:D-lactate dehydrogenase